MSLNEGRGRKGKAGRPKGTSHSRLTYIYVAVGGARLKSSATDEPVSILVNVLLHSSSSFRFCPESRSAPLRNARKSQITRPALNPQASTHPSDFTFSSVHFLPDGGLAAAARDPSPTDALEREREFGYMCVECTGRR